MGKVAESEIKKLINEDLKGIATDDDIRFIVQNYVDMKKSSLIDNPSILVSFIALSVAFLAIYSVKGISPYSILFFTIIIIALGILLPLFTSQFRIEVKRLLAQYVELRKATKAERR
jgi:hypothetical protein